MGERWLEQGDDLTPEQEQERFSTGGPSLEGSLRRVLAGGPEGDADGAEVDTTGGTMADSTAVQTVTDEEVIAEIERLRAGVMDGSVPILLDGASAYDYWLQRSG